MEEQNVDECGYHLLQELSISGKYAILGSKAGYTFGSEICPKSGAKSGPGKQLGGWLLKSNYYRERTETMSTVTPVASKCGYKVSTKVWTKVSTKVWIQSVQYWAPQNLPRSELNDGNTAFWAQKWGYTFGSKSGPKNGSKSGPKTVQNYPKIVVGRVAS